MGFLSIADLMMGKTSDKPICLGKPPIDSAACRLCPFERECQETKLKILQCFGFGHCRPAGCKGCPKLEECRAKTQKNIIARVTKKIPVRVLEDALRSALGLLGSPSTLMDSLSRMPVTVKGETYNCGDVLKGLADGSANFEDGGRDPVISAADLDALFAKPTVNTPPAKPSFFETYHCKSMTHCKFCRGKRSFRENIARHFDVGGDIDFWCPIKGAIDDEDDDEELDDIDERNKTLGDPDWDDNLIKAAETMRSTPLDEVVCVNNTGMEDKFDLGVTYVFEAHDDADMLWVTDKAGQRRESLKERFQMPKTPEQGHFNPEDEQEEDWAANDIPF